MGERVGGRVGGRVIGVSSLLVWDTINFVSHPHPPSFISLPVPKKTPKSSISSSSWTEKSERSSFLRRHKKRRVAPLLPSAPRTPVSLFVPLIRYVGSEGKGAGRGGKGGREEGRIKGRCK